MHAALLVGAIAVLLGYLARYPRYRFCFPLAFVVIAVFLSIRYMWGNDMPGYYNIFKTVNDYDNSCFDIAQSEKWELGWIILNRLFKPFGFIGLQAFLSIFQNVVIYKFIKKYTVPGWYWLSIFIYCFSDNFMPLSASMMRQFLAMIIFLLAMEYAFDKKLIPYVALVVLASLFHQSAIFLLPVYFLNFFDYKFGGKHLIWFVIFIFIWYLSLSGIASDFIFDTVMTNDKFDSYQGYLNNYSGTNALNAGLGFLIKVIVLIYIFVNLSDLPVRRDRIAAVYSLVPFFLIPLSIPLISRIGYYFDLFSIIAIPNVLNLSKQKGYIKYAVLVLYIILLLWDYFSFFNSPVWNEGFYNYHTIFDTMY